MFDELCYSFRVSRPFFPFRRRRFRPRGIGRRFPLWATIKGTRSFTRRGISFTPLFNFTAARTIARTKAIHDVRSRTTERSSIENGPFPRDDRRSCTSKLDSSKEDLVGTNGGIR